jgi:hypothetical protein
VIEFILPWLFLAFTCFFAWELRQALRDGETFFDGWYGDRGQSPQRFWFGIGLNVTILAICLIIFAGSLTRLGSNG